MESDFPIGGNPPRVRIRDLWYEPLAEALIASHEGKTEKLKNPHPLGSLARWSWLIGRLGGWDGYHGHGYKPAGPKNHRQRLAKIRSRPPRLDTKKYGTPLARWERCYDDAHYA